MIESSIIIVNDCPAHSQDNPSIDPEVIQDSGYKTCYDITNPIPVQPPLDENGMPLGQDKAVSSGRLGTAHARVIPSPELVVDAPVLSSSAGPGSRLCKPCITKRNSGVVAGVSLTDVLGQGKRARSNEDYLPLDVEITPTKRKAKASVCSEYNITSSPAETAEQSRQES